MTEADIKETLLNIMNGMFPVGYIYLSTEDTDPSTFFGGTWQRIKDVFLLCAGDTYAAGTTGGEATHALTPGETAMKAHYHNIDANGVDAYMLTVPVDGSSVYRRTIKNGTGSELTNNYYGASAITRRGVTGTTTAVNGAAHNNMPPYTTIYAWKKISNAITKVGGGTA